LLVEQLPTIASASPVPQQGEPTYAEKLTVEEFRLDPARGAAELDRIVRAGNPRPGAWIMVGGKRV
jgi:methionyl-tRNA formyltransferase